MPPSGTDPSYSPDIENMRDSNKQEISEGKMALKIFMSSVNLLAYILIGITVGVCLLFSFSFGMPLGATAMHIVLCVIGYQLLMAIATLSQSPDNGWSSFLSLRDKRRAHTILQVAGCGLAVAGSFIKILDKEVHWNTLHGQFGLVALVFTAVSLVNGLTSLYAYEWRRWLPGNISKLTHICFGIVAFVSASISLGYGMDKGFFRTWATDAFTVTLMVFIGIFTFIVIFNPMITFVNKFQYFVKK